MGITEPPLDLPFSWYYALGGRYVPSGRGRGRQQQQEWGHVQTKTVEASLTEHCRGWELSPSFPFSGEKSHSKSSLQQIKQAPFYVLLSFTFHFSSSVHVQSTGSVFVACTVFLFSQCLSIIVRLSFPFVL